MFSLAHDRCTFLSWFILINSAVLLDGRVIYDKSVRAGSVDIFWTLEGFNIAMAIVAPGSGYVSIGFSKVFTRNCHSSLFSGSHPFSTPLGWKNDRKSNCFRLGGRNVFLSCRVQHTSKTCKWDHRTNTQHSPK